MILVARILNEAIENVLRAGVRGLTIVVLGACALVMPMIVEAQELERLAGEEASLFLAGRTVLVVEAPGHIDRPACAQLANNETVLAAGSLASTPTVLGLNEESSLVGVTRISVGAVNVLDSLNLLESVTDNGGQYSGVLVSPSLAAAAGLTPTRLVQSGPALAESWPGLVVTGTAEATVIAPGVVGTALVIDGDWGEPGDLCIAVGVVPLDDHLPQILDYIAATAPADEVDVRPAIRISDLTIDPGQSLANRPTRLLWLGSGSLVGFIVGLSHWFRRSEAGLYHSVGLSLIWIGWMRVTESVLLVSSAAGLAFASAAVIWGSRPEAHWYLSNSASTGVLPGWLAALSVANLFALVSVVSRQPAELAKER